MNILSRIIGALLILFALQDVFHTLFHPAKQGDISDWIARRIWRILRRLSARVLSFAGPVAFVTTVLYWVLSIIIGCALIYLPALPRSFVFAPGINPAAYQSILGAINLSLAALITLSTGVYSNKLWIGLVMSFESIVGFGLLAASVSWILSIYPIVEHRKSLAHSATLLHFAEIKGIRSLADISDSELSEILFMLASQLTTCRNELLQFPITYYFHEDEQETSLAGVLHYLDDIAVQNLRRKGAAALAAATLGGAVEDYLKVVANVFLKREFSSRSEILGALAADHLREPVRSPRLASRAA